MATIIVTSIQDSGTGSLRQAIESAQDGDVILFDPTVFPPGQTTAILLSSRLSVAKTISICGGEADGNGGYTSGATKRNYVYRDINDVKTKVYVDNDHPALEGETVLFELNCRVALDGQNAAQCVYLGSGESTWIGVRFQRGYSATYSGCVYTANAAKINFVDCSFNDCNASAGGVFYSIQTSQILLTDCVIDNCNATELAGAVYAVADSNSEITRCTISNCSAPNGGALYSHSATRHSLASCVFYGCTASNYGGAVRSDSASQNTFEGCVFDACTAANGGAVYSASSSQNTFEGCEFNACSASTSGGAVYSTANSSNTFEGCAVDECTSNYGGAVSSYSNSQNAFDSECVLRDCEATHGSGVYDASLRSSVYESATFINCEYVAYRAKELQTTWYFTSTADSGDGSLRAAIAASSQNDVIEPDPTAFPKGSVITIKLSSPLSWNKRAILRGAGRKIVLDGQGASRIMTIPNGDSAIIAEDVDFVGGYDVSNNGAAIHITGVPGAIFTRSIIAGCYGTRVIYATGAAGLRLTSSVVAGNYGVTAYSANVATMAVGSTICGNYVNGAAVAGVNTRIFDGINSATPSTCGFKTSPPDTLAAENWNADLWKSWDLSLTSESPFASGAEALSEIDALVAGDDANYDYDGFPRKPYKSSSQPGGALGAYETRENAILVMNANDSGAGSLRQTIASAQDGDSILFSYAFFPKNETTTILLSSTLSVTKSVEIDGDGRVTLDGQDAIRVIALGVADKSPHVKNLTIQNGAYANGAGLLFQGGTPIATNCIIENCSATSSCGGVYGYSNAVATLNNCDIRYNTAANNAGGVYANNTSQLTFNDCDIHGNSAVNNGGGAYVASAASVVFNNCRIYENHIDSNGGALFTSGGTAAFNNCIVNNNTTDANDQTLKDVCVNNGSVDISDSNIDVLRFYGATALHVSGAITTVGTLRIIANNNVAATVNIDDGAALTITDAATIPTGSTFTSPGIGMIGKGAGVDLSSATLTNILVCEIGAGVTSVSGAKIGRNYSFNLVSADNTKPVLIEYKGTGDSSWTIAETNFVGSTYSATLDGDYEFRVYDGETFHDADIKVYGLYSEMAAKVAIGYLI